MSFYHNCSPGSTILRRRLPPPRRRDAGRRFGPGRIRPIRRRRSRTRKSRPEEIFEVARLVVSAEIAKIHTIEWTLSCSITSLCISGMNGNWNGLSDGHKFSQTLLRHRRTRLASDVNGEGSRQRLVIVFASGPGIIGLGSREAGLRHQRSRRRQRRCQPLRLAHSISRKNSSPSTGCSPYTDLIEYRESDSTQRHRAESPGH